jgi:hypothetical protein
MDMNVALDNERSVTRAKEAIAQALAPFTPHVKHAAIVRALFELDSPDRPLPMAPQEPQKKRRSPKPKGPDVEPALDALALDETLTRSRAAGVVAVLNPKSGRVEMSSQASNPAEVRKVLAAQQAVEAPPVARTKMDQVDAFMAGKADGATTKDIAKLVYGMRSKRSVRNAGSLLWQMERRGRVAHAGRNLWRSAKAA